MSDPNREQSADLSMWFALGVPIVSYALHFVAGAQGTAFYETYINGEFGATELMTLVFLAVAIWFGLDSMRRASLIGQRIMPIWLAIFSLGAFYFLGEEASWGQHVFGWETPEGWARVNDQEETNLHNSPGLVGGLLDNLPRAVLTAAALVVGFAYPVWRALRGIRLPTDGLGYWLFPTAACVAVGLIAPLSSLPGKIYDVPPPVLDLAYGEIKELMLAEFLMLYAMSLSVRLRAAQAKGSRSAPGASTGTAR